MYANRQTCAESPPGDSVTPQPSSTRSCECSRAPKKPLPKCPDGEPMTANYQGLRQIVSAFPRASTVHAAPAGEQHEKDFRI